MGIKNPEALYVEGGCKMLIAGKVCGKPITAEVHQTEDGHIFQEE